MAQEFGAAHYDRLRRVVGISGLLSVFFALFLVAGGQLAVNPVLALLQTPGDILGGTTLYLRIMFLGIPVVMAYHYQRCLPHGNQYRHAED